MRSTTATRPAHPGAPPMIRTLGTEFVHFPLEQDSEVTLIDAA